MDAPRTSLNALLPWPQTACLLGLPLTEIALPAPTTCPLCRGRALAVYPDPGHGERNARQAGGTGAAGTGDLGPRLGRQALAP
jgi:hypothetical protein